MDDSSETETDYSQIYFKFLTELGLALCSYSFNIYLENVNMLREVLKRFRLEMDLTI